MRISPSTWVTFFTALSSPALGLKNRIDGSSLVDLGDGWWDESVGHSADQVVEGYTQLLKRMPAADPNVMANNLTGADPANIDQVQVDSVLSAACAKGVPLISHVANDAGLLGCYNIPFLNTWSGVFSADLKLYQVTKPKGQFAGVQSEQIQVSLSYPNAAFSVLPKDPQIGRSVERRQASTSSGDELQTFLFVGKVNDDLTLGKLEDKDLMALLIPSISLSAPNPQNPSSSPPVVTNLTSSSIWFFVAGVFEGQNDLAAAASVPDAAAIAATAAAEFVLPGTGLAIFPLGLVITSVWALLFVATVGYGTWGRIQFRDQFRQRTATAHAAATRPI